MNENLAGSEVMRYHDKIYGELEIIHPLLIELMESRPLQRLKKVNQYGPFYLRDRKLATTRFEHSVGCAILLQKFGAPIEAQAAGLLHDVAHGAFSHMTDFIFGKQKTQDWHDGLFDKVIVKSEISEILKRYGLDADDVRKERWPIASRDLPELSADKIDYGLRDAVLCEVLSEQDVSYLLENLAIEHDEWCFTTVIAARMFAMKFNETCDKFWANPFWTVFQQRFADIVKEAIRNGTLGEEDLHLTDDVVMFKLMKDPASAGSIEKLVGLDVEETDHDYDMHVTNKVRLCNPKIFSGGHFIRLSEVDEDFKEKLDRMRCKIESGRFVKILN